MQVGSGKTALDTLLHEGGHAAHFANIEQNSPFFSQERAPMSVAYAENQSMFLDSFGKDAAWLGRYAYSRSVRCSSGARVALSFRLFDSPSKSSCCLDVGAYLCCCTTALGMS